MGKKNAPTAEAEAEVPNVPLHFTELYSRVRQALSPIGETVIAIEWPRWECLRATRFFMTRSKTGAA